MNEFSGIVGLQKANYEEEMHKMLRVMSMPNEVETYPISFNSASFGQTDASVGLHSHEHFCLGIQGRIYNIESIKHMLLEKGQVLHRTDPSSLLITAYQTWGPSFLEKLDGHFVLFIYDQKEKRLLLGRDKMGAHRVYWGKYPKHFLFSTSFKSLLATKYVPQKPCLESIASYLYLGYFPQDKTPIAQLNCLLPGYYLLVDRDINIVLNKYWSFKETVGVENKPSSLEEVTESIDHLLTKALKKRNPRNEPSVCYLQGELGSATLPHYFKKLGWKNPFNYSNNFDNQPNCYLPFTEHISQKLSIPYQQKRLKAEDLFKDLAPIIWHLDEPIGDPLSVLIWDFAKQVPKGQKRVFTSLGCTEFLGSHSNHETLSYEPLFLWFVQLMRPLAVNSAIPLISKLSKKHALKALRYYQKDFWASGYIQQTTLFDKKTLKSIAPQLYLEFDFDIYIHQTYQYLKYIHYQNFDINDYFFYDAETALCNHYLIQYRNLFKAHNLDLECPFLDQDLTMYLVKTPEIFKSKRKKPALPLAELLKGQINPPYLHYEYRQSPVYLNNWCDLVDIKSVFRFLERGTLSESGIIEEKALRKEIAKTPCPVRQFQRLWALLVLEIWFQLFINRPAFTYPNADQLFLYAPTELK